MVSKAAQAEHARRSTIAALATQLAAKQADVELSAKILDACSHHATRKIETLKAHSKLFTKDELQYIPKFSREELDLGKVLGKGGFGTVNEVLGFRCKAVEGGDSGNSGNSGNPAGSSFSSSSDGFAVEDVREQEFQDKKFIADHCIREGGDARYAIKALSPEIQRDPNEVIQGTIDMAIETLFLSVVSHPHIIQMRAFSANTFTPSYFIVMDRLYDTLEARIPKWKLEEKRAKSVVNKMRKRSVGKLGELMEIKLSYCYDLMGAIEYLHKHHLVYRDLKPENVGFNVRDDIVLFDFGLVREIYDKDKVTDDTWKLTGETGSIRYMAPEVSRSDPYGYSADIYSFGIMLWEILKCEKPFANYNKKMHSEMVVQKHARPKVELSWSPSLQGFLRNSWHQDLSKRPSAMMASRILKREAAKASGGEDLELNNFRRKSTFVNRDSLRERSKVNHAFSMP